MRFNEAIDQALAQSAEQYNEGVQRSKDLFLGVLGHDLRNPASAILMLASRMSTLPGQNAAQVRVASRIVSSSLRMKAIISDLLDFTSARLGDGIPLAPAEMDLLEVCEETVEEIAVLHADRAINLEATGSLLGRWDGSRLGQLLSNLIGNAVQHGGPGQPVTVKVEGGPDAVVLSIHNWGPAIPEDRLGEIFLPMKRFSNPASPSSGLGLGLFIAREIALGHGGDISVESTQAEGTTFTVRLPRRAPTAEEARASTQH